MKIPFDIYDAGSAVFGRVLAGYKSRKHSSIYPALNCGGWHVVNPVFTILDDKIKMSYGYASASWYMETLDTVVAIYILTTFHL